MNILPNIDLDIVVLIFLIIVIFLYRSKFNIKDKANKIYVSVMITSAVVIVLEILDKVILQYKYAYLVPFTKIINVLGFTLSPIASYLWLMYVVQILDVKINKKIVIAPTIINAILSITTYNNGYIFTVSSSNFYERGILFAVPILITHLYFIITIYIINKNKSKLEKKEYKYLILFEIMPIVAMIFQVIFIELMIVWASVGISIIIYYLYIQERLITHDSLTGVLNRFAFESYVTNFLINRKVCFSLINIDLDDFKLINDTYGHEEGDMALKDMAKFLKNYFVENGKVFRMGGDEFIIIVSCYDKYELNEIACDLKEKLESYNDELNKEYRMGFSYGYDTFNYKYEDFDTFMKSVDKLMYLDKKNKKSKKL